MNEYRLLATLTRILVIFILIAFTSSLVNLSVTHNEALFKINSALVYPALVCVVLFICLILDGVIDYRESRRHKRTEVSADIKSEYKLVTAVFLAVTIYVLLMKYVTLSFSLFPAATIVYATLITTLINDTPEPLYKRVGKALLVSTCFVLTIYYSFSIIFLVLLP